MSVCHPPKCFWQFKQNFLTHHENEVEVSSGRGARYIAVLNKLATFKFDAAAEESDPASALRLSELFFRRSNDIFHVSKDRWEGYKADVVHGAPLSIC